ncbi:MAG: glycosyltransferase family 39 protein [Anaerolineales bacterium]|nr:glycosyltransferase family 39 protein [Chloroflexota bacterium]MBL6980230.1 glycosyltransferase family 39 protein [Anaerolineales bacterium]
MARRIITICILLIFLSLGMAWLSSGFESLQGWGSFLAVSILGTGLFFGALRATRRESIPRWLIWIILGGLALRLVLGVFWFIALPLWGYDSDAEVAGYVMSDAYYRDTAAWELAQSERPLTDAFSAYRSVDQYGGLLFFSATIYRYLGGGLVHHPLLIVILTATASSLAILFLWAFVRRLLGDGAARIAAWIYVFYPDAVLLGGSQMREAFTMTITAAAIYGLVLALREKTWQGGFWMLVALLLSVPLSPAYTMLLVFVLGLATMFLIGDRWLRDWRLWAVVGGLLIVGLVGLLFFGAQISQGDPINPIVVFQFWVERTGIWQTILSYQYSGWMYKLSQNISAGLYKWVVLVYGVVQPFLPAALIANGNWLWRSIAIWRALGWTLLLPILIYVPLRAVRKPRQWFVFGMSLAIWLVIFAASFRSGGDQWDNPRYRVAFSSLQIAVAAWVWVDQQRSPDPWLRRILVSASFVVVWFLPWYLRRYVPFDWSVIDVFKVFGLGLSSSALYLIWDWARSHDEDGSQP